MGISDRKILFDAAKALGAKFDSSLDVALMDRAIDEFLGIVEQRNPTALSNSGAFYKIVRARFGSLDQSQVDGFNRLLQAMGAAAWPIAWVAYGLATAWWETAKKMQPVEEGYYLGPEKAKRHQRGLRYFPHYGRGDVQLTHDFNYRIMDEKLGLGGKLIANPDLALDPEISAKIMVVGMEQGLFTGKKLGDYLGEPTDANFRQCRKIINGTDRAADIARVAQAMLQALQAGKWS
jgi:hypothetical protein